MIDFYQQMGAALMSSPSRPSRSVFFGEFELNLETAELGSNGSKAILPGQPFQVLLTLLDRPGQLVTREELKRRLWASDTFVDFDQSLNKAVNRLREALEDSAEHPRFIETVPRKGYRFIGAIQTGPLEIGTADRASDQEIILDRGQDPIAHPHGRRYILAAATTILVAATVVSFKWRSHPKGPDLATVRITKVTDNGRARDVAISADGRYVVYSQLDGEDESLRLRQVATRSDVQILPAGPGFHGLTFSPDGNYIYFVRSDPNDPYFKYLYSMPVLGGPVQRLIVDVDSPVSFSPDGHQFVFERGSVARHVVELRIANADGSGEHVLATILNGNTGLFQPGPNWSRDGRTIIAPFSITNPGQPLRWVLESISVPEGKVQEIYSDPKPLGRPVWLSNGEGVLISHYDATYERPQLWTISHPGGLAKRFTNDLAEYYPPLGITQDGKTVAAIAGSFVATLWVAPAQAASTAQQITSGEEQTMEIAETLDGRLLSTGWDGRLWLINPGGTEREALGDKNAAGQIRRCGPFMLFVSHAPDKVTLTRVNRDGTHPIKLFSGHLRYPGCSPDGKFAYYADGHRPQKIWRISLEGGSPEEFGAAMGDGVTGPLDISPDGTLLAYAFDEQPPAWKIAVIPVGGGPAIKIFRVPAGIRRTRWSPTGTGLQYLMTQNGATNIWEQPLAGGEPKQLTKFTSGLIVDYIWSSDHQRLFLTRMDVPTDVVLFSNFQ